MFVAATLSSVNKRHAQYEEPKEHNVAPCLALPLFLSEFTCLFLLQYASLQDMFPGDNPLCGFISYTSDCLLLPRLSSGAICLHRNCALTVLQLCIHCFTSFAASTSTTMMLPDQSMTAKPNSMKIVNFLSLLTAEYRFGLVHATR
jgi:hypothetical protein